MAQVQRRDVAFVKKSPCGSAAVKQEKCLPDYNSCIPSLYAERSVLCVFYPDSPLSHLQ